MSSSEKSLGLRLREKDLSLWAGSGVNTAEIIDRMGWLDGIAWMDEHLDQLGIWADSIIQSNKFDHLILLGMGGSSLAAEVFDSVFAGSEKFLRLIVVDTTSPAQINAIEVDLERTLIIVASKSGTTVETADLYSYFYSRLKDLISIPGDNLVAITDQDSWLHSQALDHQFSRVFINPSDIGGRYSALSYFGLVPAALVGVDLQKLLDHTRRFEQTLFLDANDNPADQLGLLMANNALSGKNHMVLGLAPELHSMAVWIEQLVAESTGKHQLGILPVCLNPGATVIATDHQFLVAVDFGDATTSSDYGNDLKSAADLSWKVESRYDLGAEFLKWEMATAIAGSIMGVNPFNQPNVEDAKQQTRLFVAGNEFHNRETLLESEDYLISSNCFSHWGESDATIHTLFSEFQNLLYSSEYLGVLAYLPSFSDVNAVLEAMRKKLEQKFSLISTLGYGPRYLHSTGQLHKGGPPTGCFIQITEIKSDNIPIPGREYGFLELHNAQADGDYAVLEKIGLPLMRITLKGDRLHALNAVVGDIVMASPGYE